MRILRKKGKFAEKKQRKGLWRSMVMCIAALVVFCTTYALILPAITMETQGFSCGLTEHQHSQDCYQITCGKQEYFSHTHGKECYQDKVLVCKLTERTVHHHSDDCYSKPEYACGLKESKGHAHSEGCYTTERSLICTQSECAPHTHSDGCYTVEVISCKLEESKGHSHSEDCYTDGELTCSKEESEGHTHSDACTKTKQVLTCTLAETQGHSHGGSCYEEKQVLSCGKEERKGHTHSDKCYPSDFQSKLICGQEDIPEHRHSQSCYARVCELEEHTHSELCVKSHEEFLQNQEELLNKEEQTDPKDNSSENEKQTPENSEEQPSENEEQTPENSEEQPSENEEQTPENSEEQPSENEEQTPENSEEQPSENEEQTPENSEEQPSENEEQTPENSEEHPSENEEQAPENSEEQSSKDEEQTPENSEEHPSENEEQTPENSEEQPSENEEQTPENSEEQPSENEELTTEDSEEESSGDNSLDDPDPVIGDEDPEIEVDWADPESAIEAGFYPVCDNYEEEHVHTEECYVPIDEAEELLGMSVYASGENGEGESSKVETTAQLNLSTYITSIDVNSGPRYNPSSNQIEAAIKFNFSIPESNGKFPSNNYRMELQGLDLSRIIGEGSSDLQLDVPMTLKDVNGIECGTYMFTESDGKYYVIINLTDQYLSDTASNYIRGYVQFDCSLSESSLDENGDFKTTYNDKVSLNFTPSTYYPDNPSTTLDYNLTASKSGGYNEGSNKLEYTVYVDSTKGTPDSISFSDTMTVTGGNTSSILNMDSKSVTVEKGSLEADGSHGAITEPNVSVSPNWSSTESNLSLDMSLGKLEANQYYKITYSYDLNALPNGVYNYGFQNGVSVSGTQKGQTVISMPNGVQSSVNKDYTLAKTGSRDDEAGVIHWTITVNEARLELSGLNLTDEMFKDAVNGTINISPSTGYSIVDDEVDGQTHKKIVFSEVETGTGSNRNTYTITYDTEAKAVLGETTQTNTVKLNKDTTTIKSAEHTVTYSGGAIGKQFVQSKYLPEEKAFLMDWEITLDVPTGGIKSQSTVIDSCDLYGNAGNHQILDGQTYGGTTYSVQVSYADGTPVTGFGTKYYSNMHNTNPQDEVTGGGSVMKLTFTQDIPYDASKTPIKIKFTTKANSAGVGTVTYNNKVFFDKLSAEASTSHDYPVPPSVTKKDINYNTGSSNISADATTITWRVEAKTGSPSSSKIKLVDVLPEGTSLNTGGTDYLKISNPSYQGTTLAVDASGAFDVTENGYRYHGTYVADSRTLTVYIESETNGQLLPEKSSFNMEYVCLLDQDLIATLMGTNPSHALTNSVNSWFDSVQLEPSSQTQVWWKDGPSTTPEWKLQKSGSWDEETHVLTYQVKINPGAENLIENADTLTVTDVLKYSQTDKGVVCNFLFDSPRLYKMNPDGTKGSALPGTTWSYQYSDNLSQVTTSNNPLWSTIQKTITATVPDEAALILEYQYSFEVSKLTTSSGDYWVNIQNDAALTGVSPEEKSSTTTNFAYRALSYGAGVETSNSYSFLKKSSVDGAPLAGAKFKIFKAVNQGGTWTWQETSVTSEEVTTSEYVSSSAGRFTVNKSDGYSENVLYMVQEYEAPDGYVQPDPATAPQYRFYFSNSNVSSSLPPADSELLTGAVDLTYTTGTAEVKNVMSDDRTSITVVKEWRNRDNTVLTEDLPESVTFDLYYREKGTANEGTMLSNKSVTLPVNGSQWNSTISGLPKQIDSKDVEYYFVERPVKGFVSSSVTSEDGKTMTFTNTKVSTSITLVKQWQNADGTAATENLPASVGFHVYYREKGTSNEWTELPDEAVTLPTASGQWSCKIAGLLYEINGKEVEYKLVEDPVDGYTSSSVTSEDGKTVTFTNKKNTTSIKVQKQWQDKDGNPLSNPSQPVTIKLYQKTTSGSSSGGAGGINITFAVLKNNYNQVTACTMENSVQCNPGSTFTVTVNSWRVPSLYVNGTELNYKRTSSGAYDSTNYVYEFTANADTTISGYAYNDNDGSLTYTCVEPSITPAPGGSGSSAAADGVLMGTIQLDNTNGWSYTFDNLPLTGQDESGNDVAYYYYVLEDEVANYQTSYDVNGIQQGTVVVTNRAVNNPSYTLPATGGMGTELYTVTGLALSMGAILGLMKKRKKGTAHDKRTPALPYPGKTKAIQFQHQKRKEMM